MRSIAGCLRAGAGVHGSPASRSSCGTRSSFLSPETDGGVAAWLKRGESDFDRSQPTVGYKTTRGAFDALAGRTHEPHEGRWELRSYLRRW